MQGETAFLKKICLPLHPLQKKLFKTFFISKGENSASTGNPRVRYEHGVRSKDCVSDFGGQRILSQYLRLSRY